MQKLFDQYLTVIKFQKFWNFFHGIKPNNLDKPYLGSTNLSKTKK